MPTSKITTYPLRCLLLLSCLASIHASQMEEKAADSLSVQSSAAIYNTLSKKKFYGTPYNSVPSNFLPLIATNSKSTMNTYLAILDKWMQPLQTPSYTNFHYVQYAKGKLRIYDDKGHVIHALHTGKINWCMLATKKKVLGKLRIQNNIVLHVQGVGIQVYTYKEDVLAYGVTIFDRNISVLQRLGSHMVSIPRKGCKVHVINFGNNKKIITEHKLHQDTPVSYITQHTYTNGVLCMYFVQIFDKTRSIITRFAIAPKGMVMDRVVALGDILEDHAQNKKPTHKKIAYVDQGITQYIVYCFEVFRAVYLDDSDKLEQLIQKEPSLLWVRDQYQDMVFAHACASPAMFNLCLQCYPVLSSYDVFRITALLTQGGHVGLLKAFSARYMSGND